MRERETAYIANCIPTMQTVKNMETEFETLMQFGRQKSNTLYAKNKEYDICLDDFQIRKVIGQGSFGKVYLVIHKCN
jgi:serine/threonine protein kinase